MLARAAGSADLDANAQMVRADFPRVEEASKQRVFRVGDRVERSGAVEHICSAQTLNRGRATAPILDIHGIGLAVSRNDAPCENLEPAFADKSSNSGSNLGRD